VIQQRPVIVEAKVRASTAMREPVKLETVAEAFDLDSGLFVGN
jgi:hypothetical protein